MSVDPRSEKNLENFAFFVFGAKEHPGAEQFLREFLPSVMKDCPLDLLVEVGKVVLDYRKAEIRNIRDN